MICTKGQPLKPEIKQVIVVLKDYFDRNKSTFSIREASIDIGLATVDRVMANYRKDPESIHASGLMRGRPSYSIETSHEEAIRAYVRQANIEGSHITLAMIRDFLGEKSPSESFHLSTLARTLDRWGYEFGKGTRTQHLKEKDYVVVARQAYLRKMRSNRVPGPKKLTIRPEVYLDESYVNKNHSNDFIWYSNEDGPWVQKPTGKGERLIIMNAMTQHGWVPNAKLVFKSTKKTGDYHGQMNAQLFQKWFVEKLLPNLPENALIVMDNASYHNALASGSAPTPTCTKAKIRAWLEANKIPCKEDCLKVELVEILKKIGPSPLYAVDEIALNNGHEVVRTPPYHPELQPIEICWGVVKNEVARHCDFTMENMLSQLDNAFKKVTAKTCQGILKKVRDVEEKFWKEDARLDQEM